MALVTLGALVTQWPLGWLSDRFDRRRVMLGAALVGGAAPAVVAAGFVEPAASLAFVAMFVLGAATHATLFAVHLARERLPLAATDGGGERHARVRDRMRAHRGAAHCRPGPRGRRTCGIPPVPGHRPWIARGVHRVPDDPASGEAGRGAGGLRPDGNPELAGPHRAGRPGRTRSPEIGRAGIDAGGGTRHPGRVRRRAVEGRPAGPRARTATGRPTVPVRGRVAAGLRYGRGSPDSNGGKRDRGDTGCRKSTPAPETAAPPASATGRGSTRTPPAFRRWARWTSSTVSSARYSFIPSRQRCAGACTTSSTRSSTSAASSQSRVRRSSTTGTWPDSNGAWTRSTRIFLPSRSSSCPVVGRPRSPATWPGRSAVARSAGWSRRRAAAR